MEHRRRSADGHVESTWRRSSTGSNRRHDSCVACRTARPLVAVSSRAGTQFQSIRDSRNEDTPLLQDSIHTKRPATLWRVPFVVQRPFTWRQCTELLSEVILLLIPYYVTTFKISIQERKIDVNLIRFRLFRPASIAIGLQLNHWQFLTGIDLLLEPYSRPRDVGDRTLFDPQLFPHPVACNPFRQRWCHLSHTEELPPLGPSNPGGTPLQSTPFGTGHRPNPAATVIAKICSKGRFSFTFNTGDELLKQITNVYFSLNFGFA